MVRRLSVGLVLGLLLSACGNPLHRDDPSDHVGSPKTGACRDLTASDLNKPTNATAVVPCSVGHTAQTFASGPLPASTGRRYTDSRHADYVQETCQRAFLEFTGADESLMLRSQLSWSWFRPSELGWSRGARWYRCDLVGGPSGASRLRDLPPDAAGILAGSSPDRWLTCARGTSVTHGAKVPCTSSHTWRAVTTIKLGEPADPYPGDDVVETRTRDYCQGSVGGYLHYPHDYQYGYTWFHRDRWEAGNRRSVCWARMTR